MAAKKKAKKPVAKKKVVKRAKAKVAVARKLKAIPDGYPRLMTIAVIDRCGDAIEFYKNVFGAKERMRMPTPDGRVAHCELQFGDSVLMLADNVMGAGVSAPRLSLYVENCDHTWQQAVVAGARSTQEPQDQFYGDRSARLIDPFGLEWSVMTHVEDVSEQEMMRRMAQLPPPPPEDHQAA